jgi:hypothetical protein
MAARTSAPTPIRFEAEVESLAGRRIVRLPAEASAQLPSRGQVAVEGRLDGHAFADVVEPDGLRGHWLALDRPRNEADDPVATTADGDSPQPGSTVALELTPAAEWPEPELPADFREALENAPASAATWSDITPMARWEWVRWVTSTRSPATRARRIEVGLDKLDRGSRRPCCFDLSSCTDPDLAKSGKLLPPA